MMKNKTEIEKELKDLWGKIAGQNSQLVAVSKTFPMQAIVDAYDLGQRAFGENRVQEFIEKSQKAFDAGMKDIEWHFIGHIQSNKMKKLLGCQNLSYIHSIDSKKQIDLLFKYQEEIKGKVRYLLQVNTSMEEEKSGIENEKELLELWNYAKEKEGENSSLSLAGLMTIGKIRTDDFEKDAKICFQKMVDYKETIEKETGDTVLLSMGMSQDYHLALDYGSDFVRIGSMIFGER